MKTYTNNVLTVVAAILASVALAACFQPDFRRECLAKEDCREGEVCLFSNCVDRDMAAPEPEPEPEPDPNPDQQQCNEGETLCGGACVDTKTDLAFCGGCDGCTLRPNTDATRCEDGVCILSCIEGFFDANNNTNGPINRDGCECTQTEGGIEICDGLDNNCSGSVDSGPGLNVDLCDAVPNTEVNFCSDGACVYQCVGRAFDINMDLDTGPAGDGCECVQTTDPTEVCDGADNDCDGEVDDEDDTFILARCPDEDSATIIGCQDGFCIYRCNNGFVDADDDLGRGGNGCECQPAIEACN